MHAVIKTGGKQYRVSQGQTLKVEKLVAELGTQVDFDQVLMIGEGEKLKIGQPFVAGAKVKAEIVRHGRHEKIKIIKFRRRKHHMKKMGHRQHFTEVKITAING